jgi:thiamine pyrophosphate-dependent acetolactate synthase large subunit-like protein
MKIKAANGVARILKAEGIPWVSCYPTNHVNNALGEEGVPILMMGEERFAVAVADGFSRVTCGKQIGACTVMANLNAAGIQMAYGAIAQAWEDSSPLLVIAEGRRAGREPAHALRHGGGVQVGHQVGREGRPRRSRCPTTCAAPSRSSAPGGPGPVLLIVPRDLGEYEEDEHPYAPVKGWRSGPDPDDVRSAVRTLLAAKDPLFYVGEGRSLRGCHRRAPAARRAGAGAGADDAQGQGRLPRKPPAVGRGARLARRALSEEGRRPVLDRLEPLPEPVQPRDSRRGQEDHRAVHGGHARHQPEL